MTLTPLLRSDTKSYWEVRFDPTDQEFYYTLTVSGLIDDVFHVKQYQTNGALLSDAGANADSVYADAVEDFGVV